MISTALQSAGGTLDPREPFQQDAPMGPRIMPLSNAGVMKSGQELSNTIPERNGPNKSCAICVVFRLAILSSCEVKRLWVQRENQSAERAAERLSYRGGAEKQG